MENQALFRRAGMLALLGAVLALAGCASDGHYSGGVYFGDPYWDYGPSFIYDDDDGHHRPGDGQRPPRPEHPIALPDGGNRPSQLPSHAIPASAPRPSMGGGGRGGGGRGGGGRR